MPVKVARPAAPAPPTSSEPAIPVLEDDVEEDLPRLAPLAAPREQIQDVTSSENFDFLSDNDGADWDFPDPNPDGTPENEDEEREEPDDAKFAPFAEDGGVATRRKRRMRVPKEAQLEWDAEETDRSDRAATVKRSSMAWIALGMLAATGTLVFVVSVIQSGARTGSGAPVEVHEDNLATAPITSLFAAGAVPPRDVLMSRSSEILDLARPQVVRFLESENVDTRLETVRSRERVEPLMRAFYARNPDNAIPFRQIAPDGGIVMKDNICVVQVLLEDWSTRQIALDLSCDPPMVDWESYVAYSEATLSELREQPSTRPALVRAAIEWAAQPYFNYDFSDEEKYDCYIITQPDDPAFLFGYAERLQPAATRLRELTATAGTGQFLAVVKLRYPENPRTNNQVIIDEVITEGWVLPDATPAGPTTDQP